MAQAHKLEMKLKKMTFFDWLVHVLGEWCSQGRLNKDIEDKHMARLSEARWCFSHWSSKELPRLT